MLFKDEGRVLDQILEAAEKDGAAAVVDEILDLRSIEAQGRSASETLATAGLPAPNTRLPHLKSAPRAGDRDGLAGDVAGLGEERCGRCRQHSAPRMAAVSAVTDSIFR